MSILEFPPLESADEDGLLAIGGDLEVDSLLLAYKSGIFPWPINGPINDGLLAWFSPPERAVLFVEEFHISRSLKRSINQSRFTTRVDSSFREVIASCAEITNRGDQGGTLIIPDIISAYTRLHELGFAHSFETYLDDKLVGGIYGVRINNFFAAESSFYREPNASKFAMLNLLEYLKSAGIAWFDCQVLTPFSESFGAREITRAEYIELLNQSLSVQS